MYIVETAERRGAPWTTCVGAGAGHLQPYGNNLMAAGREGDKLSRHKPWRPAAAGGEAESSPSTTRLKRASPTVEPRRTGGRGAERSLKRNNEDRCGAALPPLPPPAGDPTAAAATPPSAAVPRDPASAAGDQGLSPVASSTDANLSDLESSTSGSFLVLGPHGTSRLACVSEL